MAEWEEFKYAPEWQGPLPGRSFEKQTEDAINKLARYADERIAEAVASSVVVQPFTGTPSDLGIASPGSSDKYARGDHSHRLPESVAAAGVAGRLEPGFSIELTGDVAGAVYGIKGNGAVQINASLAAMPKLSGVGTENTSDAVAGADESVVLPSDKPAKIVVKAGRGVAASIEEDSTGETDLVNVKLGADFSAVATASEPGFMTPQDKAALDSIASQSANILAGVTPDEAAGTLVFTTLTGDEVVVPAGGGGGSVDLSEYALKSEALSDIEAGLTYSTELPERYASGAQTIVITGLPAGGDTPVSLFSGTHIVRACEPFQFLFSTEAVNEADATADTATVSMHLSAIPDQIANEAESAGIAVTAPALAVGASSTVKGVPLSIVWNPGMTPDPLPGQYEYGAFSVTWTRRGLFDYEVAIVWDPAVAIFSQTPQQASASAVYIDEETGTETPAGTGGTSPASVLFGSAPTLSFSFTTPRADGIETDAARLSVALSPAIPGAADAAISRSVLSGEGLSINAADLAADGDSAIYSGIGLAITWAAPDDNHVNGVTSEFGTFSLVWSRHDPAPETEGATPAAFGYTVELSWHVPAGAIKTEPGAALVIEESKADGGVETTAVDFSVVAQKIEGTIAEIARVESKFTPLLNEAIVSVSLTGETSQDAFTNKSPAYVAIEQGDKELVLASYASLPMPSGTAADPTLQFREGGVFSFNGIELIEGAGAGAYCHRDGVDAFPAIGESRIYPLSGANPDGSTCSLKLYCTQEHTYQAALVWTRSSGTAASSVPAYLAMQGVETALDGEGNTVTTNVDLAFLPLPAGAFGVGVSEAAQRESFHFTGTPDNLVIRAVLWDGAPQLSVYATLQDLPHDGTTRISAIAPHCSLAIPSMGTDHAYSAAMSGTNPDLSTFTIRIVRDNATTYTATLDWEPYAGNPPSQTQDVTVIDPTTGTSSTEKHSVLPAALAIVADGAEVLFTEFSDVPVSGRTEPRAFTCGTAPGEGEPMPPAPAFSAVAVLGSLPPKGKTLITALGAGNYAEWTAAYPLPPATADGTGTPVDCPAAEAGGLGVDSGSKLSVRLENLPGAVGCVRTAWQPQDMDTYSPAGGEKHATITMTTVTAGGEQHAESVDVAALVKYLSGE